MTKNEILQWFAVKRGAVCVDRSEVEGLPGYLRHVTLRAPGRIEVEFLWHTSDEGGPTFVADSEDLDESILSLEEYFGRAINEWENFSTTDRYPEVEAGATRNSERLRSMVKDRLIPLPPHIMFSIRESYWRALADG